MFTNIVSNITNRIKGKPQTKSRAKVEQVPDYWKSSDSICYLSRIPQDIFYHILKQMDTQTVIRLMSTSKHWFYNEEMWKQIVLQLVDKDATNNLPLWRTLFVSTALGWGPVVSDLGCKVEVRTHERGRLSITITIKNFSKTQTYLLPLSVDDKYQSWNVFDARFHLLAGKYHPEQSFQMQLENPRYIGEQMESPPSWIGYPIVDPGQSISQTYSSRFIEDPKCCDAEMNWDYKKFPERVAYDCRTEIYYVLEVHAENLLKRAKSSHQACYCSVAYDSSPKYNFSPPTPTNENTNISVLRRQAPTRDSECPVSHAITKMDAGMDSYYFEAKNLSHQFSKLPALPKNTRFWSGTLVSGNVKF